MLKTTRYFDEFASRKHPEIRREWIEAVIANPVRTEEQPNNRIAHWGNIEDAGDRVLRVITLEDGETVHNAFLTAIFINGSSEGKNPDENSILFRY
ncbi:MAG: hypothetical protein SNJ57_13710 [Cyanobacteriota bacterium]